MFPSYLYLLACIRTHTCTQKCIYIWFAFINTSHLHKNTHTHNVFPSYLYLFACIRTHTNTHKYISIIFVFVCLHKNTHQHTNVFPAYLYLFASIRTNTYTEKCIYIEFVFLNTRHLHHKNTHKHKMIKFHWSYTKCSTAHVFVIKFQSCFQCALSVSFILLIIYINFILWRTHLVFRNRLHRVQLGK